jgi:hypothetical protein
MLASHPHNCPCQIKPHLVRTLIALFNPSPVLLKFELSHTFFRSNKDAILNESENCKQGPILSTISMDFGPFSLRNRRDRILIRPEKKYDLRVDQVRLLQYYVARANHNGCSVTEAADAQTESTLRKCWT